MEVKNQSQNIQQDNNLNTAPEPKPKVAAPKTIADLILQTTQQNNQLLAQIATNQEEIYELQRKFNEREKYKLAWSIGKFALYIILGIIASTYLTKMIASTLASVSGGLLGAGNNSQSTEISQLMNEIQGNSGNNNLENVDTEALIKELTNFLK